MSFESIDLTGFTEYDPPGYLTVTADQLAAVCVSMTNNESVFKNYGADYFDSSKAWKVRFSCEWGATSWNRQAAICAFGSAGGFNTLNGNYHLMCFMYPNYNRIQLSARGSAGSSQVLVSCSAGTRYYITIEVDPVSQIASLTVRTGSHEGTIVDSVKTIDISSGYDFGAVPQMYAWAHYAYPGPWSAGFDSFDFEMDPPTAPATDSPESILLIH